MRATELREHATARGASRRSAARCAASLIDRVCARRAQTCGDALAITSLDTGNAERFEQPELLPRIGEALDELEGLEPELAHVVDLKFFCGSTMTEIAALQNVSDGTVQRQREKARLLLHRALSHG